MGQCFLFVRHFCSWSVNPVESNKHINMDGDSSNKKIEDCKPESEHINLKVTGQDGSVVHFKIKKNTPLRKLMGAYCNRAGITTGVVRFRFDGNPINDEDTPAMLEMKMETPSMSSNNRQGDHLNSTKDSGGGGR